jgi:hypothetical protein
MPLLPGVFSASSVYSVAFIMASAKALHVFHNTLSLSIKK